MKLVAEYRKLAEEYRKLLDNLTSPTDKEANQANGQRVGKGCQ